MDAYTLKLKKLCLFDVKNLSYFGHNSSFPVIPRNKSSA